MTKLRLSVLPLGLALAFSVSFTAGCEDGTSSSDGGTAGSGGRGGSSGTTGRGGAGGAGGYAGGSAGTAGGGSGGSAAGTSGGGSGGSAGTSGTSGGTGGGAAGTSGGTGGGAAGTSGGTGGGTAGSAGGGTGGGTAGTAGGGSGGSTAGTSGGGAGGTAGGAGGTAGGAGGTAGATGGTGGVAGSPSDAGTDGSPDGAEAGTDAGPTCTNACTLGAHQCAGGGTQTCVAGSGGCTVWGTAVPCAGAQICASASGLCACPTAPAGCSQDGATVCAGAGSAVATCHVDAQGCFTTTTASCPTHQSCKGSSPSAACGCDDECPGTGNVCSNLKTITACGNDSNVPACIVVTSTTTCLGVSVCSAGACVCPAAAATPAAGAPCGTQGATACSGSDILTCGTETGSGCLVWTATTQCAANAGGALTCGIKGGSPACQCPENAGTDVYVDPDLGSDGTSGALYPTGIASPPACRFATLGNSLAKVGAPGRVIAISASAPTTFGAEIYPLIVPAGVKLTTADAALNPAQYTIAFDDGAATEAVRLGAGATLEGFTVANAGGAAAAFVTCNAGAVTLSSLVLEGGGYGVRVQGSCSSTITATRIRGFSASALALESTASSSIFATELADSMIGLVQQNGAVNAHSLNVHDNAAHGILLVTNSPTLVLGTNSIVTKNGLGGSTGFAGINVTQGALSATTTNVTGNGGPGIILSSTSTQSLTTVDASSNGAITASPGVTVTAGIVNANGLTATQNTQSGVVAMGGTVSLVGATLNANTERGLAMAGGIVNVSGGSFAGNGLAGIVATAGSLSIGGSADVAGNGTYGLHLAGATTLVTSADIHGNTLDGVFVNQSTGVTVNLGATGNATQIRENHGSGILVGAAPTTSSGANSLTVDNVTVTSNDGCGVRLTGASGAVAATVRNSRLATNRETGLLIEQGTTGTTASAIQGNDILGNNTGLGRSVGGVLFATASTVTSFIGNKIHGNRGDELGFGAAPNGGGAWVVGPGSCSAASNSIHCYGTGNVGLRAMATGIQVDARGNRWENANPAGNIDFSAVGTSSIDASVPCTVVAPACP